MKRTFGGILFVGVLMLAIGFCIGDLLVTDGSCSLCSFGETDHPCWVDLNTGEIEEICLYNTVDGDSRVIDTSQTEYGILTSRSLGETAYYTSIPDEHYSIITVEKEALHPYSEDKAKAFFCSRCMKQINAIDPDTNYLLADCYDSDAVKFYRFEAAEDTFSIRHYTFAINEQYDKAVSLTMTSSYFAEAVS